MRELTCFGIWFQRRSRSAAPGFARVHGHAPLPLGFGFQHPSAHRLPRRRRLLARVAQGNLSGFGSMDAGNTSLLLLLIHTWDLGAAVAVDLLAMVGRFVVGVHLNGRIEVDALVRRAAAPLVELTLLTGHTRT